MLTEVSNRLLQSAKTNKSDHSWNCLNAWARYLGQCGAFAEKGAYLENLAKQFLRSDFYSPYAILDVASILVDHQRPDLARSDLDSLFLINNKTVDLEDRFSVYTEMAQVSAKLGLQTLAWKCLDSARTSALGEKSKYAGARLVKLANIAQDMRRLDVARTSVDSAMALLGSITSDKDRMEVLRTIALQARPQDPANLLATALFPVYNAALALGDESRNLVFSELSYALYLHPDRRWQGLAKALLRQAKSISYTNEGEIIFVDLSLYWIRTENWPLAWECANGIQNVTLRANSLFLLAESRTHSKVVAKVVAEMPGANAGSFRE